MRHRITIQSVTRTPNAYGEPVETFATFLSCWASIEPLQGQEYQAAATAQDAVTHRIWMRHQDGVKPNMRVKFADRTSTARYYDIEAVIEPMTLGESLQLMCREIIV